MDKDLVVLQKQINLHVHDINRIQGFVGRLAVKKGETADELRRGKAKQRKAKHRRFGRALSGMGSDAELETDEQALALSDMMLDAEGSFARHGKMSLSALVESFSDPDVNNYDYLKRGLIHPHSGFRRLWDFATMYFVMYTAVVLPYFIAFDCEPEHPSFLWVKNELMDYMCVPPRLRRSRETILRIAFSPRASSRSRFYADFILNFFTCWELPLDGGIVEEHSGIAYHYATSGWMFIDFVATVPLDEVCAHTSSRALGDMKLRPSPLSLLEKGAQALHAAPARADEGQPGDALDQAHAHPAHRQGHALATAAARGQDREDAPKV